MNIKVRSALKTMIVVSLAMPVLCEVALANPPGFSPISGPPPLSGPPSIAIVEIPKDSVSGAINLENGDTFHYTTINPCPLPTDCLNSASSGMPPQMPNKVVNNITVGDSITNTQTINSPIVNQTEFLFLDTPTVLEDATE